MNFVAEYTSIYSGDPKDIAYLNAVYCGERSECV